MKILNSLFISSVLIQKTLWGVCSMEANREMALKYELNQNWLGQSTTAAFDLPVGNGCGRHYQGGSIYFRPCIGAVEVHGLIRNLWAEQGWERGPLGYAITDELKMTDGVGRVSFFQGGVVYYHPNFGTRRMTPEFHREWRDRGGVGGLGYPTSDMRCHLGMDFCSQGFERGSISRKISENASSIDLRGEIGRRGIGIRDQASRLTCSVHTITFLLEYTYTASCGFNKYLNLSEEYLNHVTNLATGREDDGDFFNNIISGYNQYGMVREESAPFMAAYQFKNYSLPTGSTAEGAKLLRDKKLEIKFLKTLSTPMGLTEPELQSILSALNRGVPVGLGRGHSMPIVGYRKDASQPGGGVFIFKNSYGLSTGTNGYQEEDFESVIRTANDAVIVEPSIQ